MYEMFRNSRVTAGASPAATPKSKAVASKHSVDRPPRGHSATRSSPARVRRSASVPATKSDSPCLLQLLAAPTDPHTLDLQCPSSTPAVTPPVGCSVPPLMVRTQLAVSLLCGFPSDSLFPRLRSTATMRPPSLVKLAGQQLQRCFACQLWALGPRGRGWSPRSPVSSVVGWAREASSRRSCQMLT